MSTLVRVVTIEGKSLRTFAVAKDVGLMSPSGPVAPSGPVCTRETVSTDLVQGHCEVCRHPTMVHPGIYTIPEAEGCLLCSLTNMAGERRAQCQQWSKRAHKQCLRGWGHELFGEKHQYVKPR